MQRNAGKRDSFWVFGVLCPTPALCGLHVLVQPCRETVCRVCVMATIIHLATCLGSTRIILSSFASFFLFQKFFKVNGLWLCPKERQFSPIPFRINLSELHTLYQNVGDVGPSHSSLLPGRCLPSTGSLCHLHVYKRRGSSPRPRSLFLLRYA